MSSAGMPRCCLPVIAAFCLYAVVFIAKTSCFVEGTTYFTLLDDQMISMRYARNLASGHGLVWNPGGERVEGFTNPLWVLYMSLFHLLPIPASKVSLCLQVSGGLFLAGAAFVAGEMAGMITGGAVSAVLAAALLTAFYFPLDNWALQGSEVSLLVLILLLCIRQVLRGLSGRRISPSLYWLAAVGIFVRMDFAVPALAIFAFLAVAGRKNRLKHSLGGLGVVSASLAALTLFRLIYYGEWLPNTYYDKLTGYPVLERAAWGVKATWDFWSVLPVPAAIIIGGLVFGRGTRSKALLLWVVTAQMLYNVYVGGDAWQEGSRYVALAAPVVFILVALSLNELRLKAAGLRGSWQMMKSYVFVPGLLASLVNLNTVGNRDALAMWLLLIPPPFVVDNHRAILISRTIDRICLPDARVAVAQAGINPYFSDRQMIDVLGKNDRYIARLEMRRGRPFRPGHLKWDYSYSIGKLKPDVVLELWMNMGEAIPFLERDYLFSDVEGLWIFLRRDSPRIRWKNVPRDKLHEPMMFFRLMAKVRPGSV